MSLSPSPSTYPSHCTPDGPSRQSSQNSSHQNSDVSYPHSIWEQHVQTIINGRETMYNVQRDADGNIHEYIKQPGKNNKYVINSMPPRTTFHPSHCCRSGGIWGCVWAIVTSVLWCLVLCSLSYISGCIPLICSYLILACRPP